MSKNPGFVLPGNLLETAEDARWSDVALALHWMEALRANVLGQPVGEHLEAMSSVAEQSDDFVLKALALAAQVEFRGADTGDEVIERHLARAVAFLQTDGGCLPLRPPALIVCARGYQAIHLWELACELALQSVKLTDSAGPPVHSSLLALDRIASLVQYGRAVADLACEAYEIDNRPGVRDWLEPITKFRRLLSGIPAASPLQRQWAQAIHDLVLALAGEASDSLDGGDLEGNRDSNLGDADGFIQLAEAVRLIDQDKPDEAAAMAAAAAARFEQHSATIGRDLGSGHYLLALKLAAGGEAEAPYAWRYARRLSSLRARDRARAADAGYARQRSAALIVEAESLSAMAYTDSLTGLVNRQGLARYRKRLEGETSSIGLLVVDVDRFKAVNDTYGHKVGDQVLAAVGQVLRTSVRGDDLVVRIGGDEFLLLLHRTNEQVMADRASLIARRVAGIDWSDVNLDLEVGVSVGWAVGSASEFDSVFHLADQGMYRVKQAARHA